MRALAFPLVAQDNRPIFDAAGTLVSVPQHAQFFVACANLVNDLANAGSTLDVIDMAMRAEKIMEKSP